MNLSKNCWSIILEHLSCEDILRISVVSKKIYRACLTPIIKKKTQGFMKYGYKLNLKQHILFGEFSSKKVTQVNFNKLVNGITFTTVNANNVILPRGEILVAISCSLYQKNNSNIIIITDPSNIHNLNDTLDKFFGIKAVVLHSSNKKYKSKEYSVDDSI